MLCSPSSLLQLHWHSHTVGALPDRCLGCQGTSQLLGCSQPPAPLTASCPASESTLLHITGSFFPCKKSVTTLFMACKFDSNCICTILTLQISTEVLFSSTSGLLRVNKHKSQANSGFCSELAVLLTQNSGEKQQLPSAVGNLNKGLLRAPLSLFLVWVWYGKNNIYHLSSCALCVFVFIFSFPM